MQIPALENFRLAGGTALALQKGHRSSIDEIKTDFMFWGDEFIQQPMIVDSIRMATALEIFAMKLDAITVRKVKKDFFDIALLLDDSSVEEGLKFYEEKYPYNDVSAVIKQLTYLDPADETPDPQMLHPVSWEAVKDKVINAVKL